MTSQLLVLSRTLKDDSDLASLQRLGPVECASVDDADPLLRRLGLQATETVIYSSPGVYIALQDADPAVLEKVLCLPEVTPQRPVEPEPEPPRETPAKTPEFDVSPPEGASSEVYSRDQVLEDLNRRIEIRTQARRLAQESKEIHR